MPEARLEVTDALGRRVVPLAKAPFEIGRRETNDLRLAGSALATLVLTRVSDDPVALICRPVA